MSLDVAANSKRSHHESSARDFSEREEEMAALWASVLGVADIDRNADFGSLNASEGAAQQLVVTIRERYDIPLDVPTLLKAGTIRGICKLIDRRGNGSLIAPAVQIPFAKSGSSQVEFRQADYHFDVPQQSLAELDSLALALGTSRAHVALAAFQAVLFRYTSAKELTITLATTSWPETNPLLLAFRTHIGDEPSFRELLQRVVSALRVALDEGDTWIEPGTRPIIYYCGDVPPEALCSHEIGLIFNESAGFKGRLTFNAERFDRFHIERLAGHLLTLISAAAKNSDESIAQLAMLSDAEIHEIVHQWNETDSNTACSLIHQAFETRATQSPDAVAVISRGLEFTYLQINQRANQLAHYLLRAGVGPDSFVGICLRRSEETIVAVLAALKAGGAYVPLDPAYPKDRLAFMLQDTKAPIVITQSTLLDRLPAGESRYLCVDRLAPELSQQSTDNPACIGSVDDRCYVIYTSGSTGRPKGVLLRHRPVANVLDWVNTTFAVSPTDRLLFVTSLSFDLSVYDIFGVLGAGGSIRVASEDELRDPDQLLHILKSEPISIWNSAPAAISQIVPFFGRRRKSEAPQHAATNLRLVMLSGDWIPVPLPDQIRHEFPSARVVSLGGATEAAIWSNWYPIGQVQPNWPSIPYGKPIRLARYHILDKYLRPVPVGVPAELYIGGDVLADGYLNRDELTKERFVHDPFANGQSGRRLYKTGDLARYFPDGNIEFLGRIDTQVKVRGFRVEAGEIEAIISQLGSVREAIVKPHKDSSGQNYLVAYVVTRTGEQISVDEIVQSLQEKLPEYMVPAHIQFMVGMPLTPNGKIDRAALLPPESTERAREYAAPENAFETAVAEIWREVLGLPQVGRNDNFFELGGHSLRAATVIARLQEKFFVELQLPTLFEKPTVAAFAQEIRSAARGETRVAIPRKPSIFRAPASLMQQRFWFLDRNVADRRIYNVADTFRIRGQLNLVALRKAWQALIDRQDALRTTFENADGWPEQIIRTPSIVNLPLVDLSDREDAEAESRRLVAEDARLDFDIVNGPLWRARLIKLGPTEHLLNWTIHHMVVDESSRSVLLDELWQSYEAALNGKSAALPELSVRYLDYSLWQRERVTPAAIDYWKQQLRSTPPPIVPPHPKARPATRSHQGVTVAFDISPSISQAIARTCRQAGVTPYIAWLAAFQTLLFRYTGQADVCIGSPVTTRPNSARDIVGCFVNTLVLRTDLSGEPVYRDLLCRTRETLMGAIQHGEVPFEKLIEELKPERIPGGHPLFQTMFIYQAAELHGDVAGLSWRHDYMERVGAKFDFTLTIEDQGGRSRGYIEYATDLYDGDTIQRYIGHFLTLVKSITAKPDVKLSELPLVPSFERDRLLRSFNLTAGDFPSASCVQQLVEEQVERSPDAIAFQFRDKTLTYRVLNEKANQLAHHLRAQGVGPDTVVGLCLERSLDVPVAMLGILKAGGAYVPLDPDFPPDRLSFYITDSKMPIIVAHHQLLDNLPVQGLRQVCVDTHAEAIALEPTTNLSPLARPENLIYVLYTSGSTGRPNGVAIEHRCLSNLLWSFKNEPGLTARDTILSITTLSFDIHTVETWLPMIVGARSVIVPRETALDGHRLIDLVKSADVTVMQSTPATWRLLLTAGWSGKPDLKALTGGEALSAELAQQLLQRTREVWNVYGPTETTVWSIIHKVSPNDDRVLIGRPVLNTQVYVLDPVSRQVMPIGCVGEIWIAGTGLARGYLGRQELTAARFLPDPFASAGDARMYKTGDLGRYLPDGTLECLGRVDHQVKVRGFRIELNEIERVLEEFEGLAQVVVTARTDDEFSAMLHAYYRCENGRSPTPVELRKFAQGRLPDYMIPATFTKLDNFPQTPNGKVDRKALPAPSVDASARPVERERVLPANDAEHALLAIWEEVLGIRPISVTDDFQELGGHSLLAAVLMSRIESRLGHRIPLEVLFEKPTVRGLADVLTRKLELGGGTMVPLQTGGSYPPLFLIAGVGGHVFAFHRFARLLGPDFPVYGMKAIGVDGMEPPLDRFEDIAARYVKEILAECPDGPFILGGYSVGGRIALEVALQLQAMGKEVPRLIVFDMFAPGYPKPLSLVRRLTVHAVRLLKLPLRDKWNYARERLRRLLKRVSLEPFQDIMVKDLDVVPQKILIDVGNALLRGNDAYMPVRKFKGTVVLVQSDIVEEWEDAVERVELQGWTPWSTEPVEAYTVRAAHLEIFKDHVQPRLAEIVRGVIQASCDETSDSVLT